MKQDIKRRAIVSKLRIHAHVTSKVCYVFPQSQFHRITARPDIEVIRPITPYPVDISARVLIHYTLAYRLFFRVIRRIII